jgi:outer membrane protein assembly factor BamB
MCCLVTTTGLVLGACSSGGSAHLGPGLAGVGKLPPPASAWPEAGFDARYSSATSVIGPQSGAVRWRRELGGDATPGPVLETDGSILAATNAGVLHDLNPTNGADLWTFNAHRSFGSDLSTSPAVLADGTVLWPGPHDTLYALSKTGAELWKLHCAGQVLSPAIAGANRVYIADLTGHVAALEITATSHREVWSIALGGVDYASPTVGQDGSIYTASGDDLVAVRDLGTRGAVLWRFKAKKMVEVSNAVTADGIVVLGTNHDKEYGITPTGSVAWSLEIGDNTYTSSIARPDGTGWIGDNMGRERIIDTETGTVRATIAPLPPGQQKNWTAVAADAHDDAYWGTTAGNIYGYTSTGVQLFAVATGSSINSYPALGPDGTLYIGTTAGTLYAIGS